MCHITLRFLGVFLAACGICTSHVHQHHRREHEEDGAFIPRDANHFKDGHDTSFDHEAILGSVKEAEDYENLSASESKSRLKILLGKMDMDGDEQISRKELNEWILKSFRMISEEESEDRLEELDVNGDGFVSWSEYIRDAFDIDDPNDMDLLSGDDKKEENKFLKEDRELFNAADLNVDGLLSKEELLLFTHPEEDPNMVKVLIKQFLDDRDENGDGSVNFQEFVGEKGKERDQEWLTTEQDRFEKDYDANHDGVMDQHEISAFLAPSNEKTAADEVVHLFESADDNGDDVLSFDEVIDHHDVFVGSEATDYGDHLENIERFHQEL